MNTDVSTEKSHQESFPPEYMGVVVFSVETQINTDELNYQRLSAFICGYSLHRQNGGVFV